MQRFKTRKLTKEQGRFVKRFIDIIFDSMAIEQEAAYTRSEAYKRYLQDAIDLVEDGTYKKVRF